jgi:hypothetical protein
LVESSWQVMLLEKPPFVVKSVQLTSRLLGMVSSNLLAEVKACNGLNETVRLVLSLTKALVGVRVTLSIEPTVGRKVIPVVT